MSSLSCGCPQPKEAKQWEDPSQHFPGHCFMVVPWRCHKANPNLHRPTAKFLLKGKILQDAWGFRGGAETRPISALLAITEGSDSLKKADAGVKMWPTWSAYLGFDEFEYTHLIYIITRHCDDALHCEMVSLTPGYITLGLHIYCVSSIVHPNNFRLWVPLFWLNTCSDTYSPLADPCPKLAYTRLL